MIRLFLAPVWTKAPASFPGAFRFVKNAVRKMGMQKVKRVIAIVIALLLLFAVLFPYGVFAKEPEGALIKGESWTTVYYVSSGHERMPFLNEATYFTYESSFDGVETISDAELAEYQVGRPIAPKAGSLIKIQTDPKVYVVDGTIEEPVLHWITSEQIAIELYGSAWAKKVMDVPPTMWPVFTFGEDITDAEDVPDEPPLYGFWGMNGYLSDEGLKDVQERFGVSMLQVASADPVYTVRTLLPLVEEARMKVTLRMSGGNSTLTTGDDFDIDKWKAAVAKWRDSGVQAYIDNGTLVGHMLLDDIFLFAGDDPTADELDEMARYSEEIMPGLMTFVRNQATTMPDGDYDYLDAIVNQYTVRQGSVYDYADREAAAAQTLGLDMIQGLNIADGGDGSSGQQGWRGPGYYAMSHEEIEEYSRVLLSMPDVKMFLMWEYDGEERWPDGTIGSDYFNQPEFEEVISRIGD